MAAVGVLQTVPSLALLAFLIALLGVIGFVPALLALFVYALLPVVRNTHAGLASVAAGQGLAAAALGLQPAQVLRHVQLPYLLPGLTAVLILRSADILKLFDMVFTMTRGGPGAATDLISIYIQRVGFRIFDMGTASAQAILLLILTIVISRLFIKVFYREIDA